MKMGELTEITDLTIWDRLFQKSPQKTRFLDPDFLNLFGVPVRYYGLFRKGVCIAGVPVIDRSTSKTPWCYYQGPIFYDEIYRSAAHKRIQYEIELAEDLATQLAVIEPEFSFSLHPSFQDIRGYDWVHFHDSEKARCKIFPRYTAILDLEGQSIDNVRKNCRSARRQEWGYAVSKEDLQVTNDGTLEELYALYLQTFARQGQAVPQHEQDLFMPYGAFFLERGVGRILTVRTQQGQAVAMALVFEDYDRMVHVPIVGTSGSKYGGTLLYFHIAEHSIQYRARGVDFNGANSPNRAYFKHSLGAHPALYFDVKYSATEER